MRQVGALHLLPKIGTPIGPALFSARGVRALERQDDGDGGQGCISQPPGFNRQQARLSLVEQPSPEPKSAQSVAAVIHDDVMMTVVLPGHDDDIRAVMMPAAVIVEGLLAVTAVMKAPPSRLMITSPLFQ